MKSSDYYYTIVRINIRKYRSMKKMTSQELADKCDLTHQFIRDLECIKLVRRPRIDTIGRIAYALEVDIRDLFNPIDEE